MVREGAALVDIGGESTRPGSDRLLEDEETARVLPAVLALAPELPGRISVDTYKSRVAAKALEAGAYMINDISALRMDPEMVAVVRDADCPVILMHMLGEPKTMQVAPTYGDVIEELDWSVGQVLDAVRRSGIEENTLVIFSSDNGPWYNGSPGRLRGRKGTTWEGGMRVPCIGRFPGRIPQGLTCRGVGSVMDLLPTVAGLTGAPLPDNRLDGIDIWPLLSGEREQMDREALLYFDSYYLQCARLGKWKLHVSRQNCPPYVPPPSEGRFNVPPVPGELYNLEKDPDESYDQADEHPEVIDGIRERIKQLLLDLPEDVRQTYANTEARAA
jgi:arylsulfatase A-like enzyme